MISSFCDRCGKPVHFYERDSKKFQHHFCSRKCADLFRRRKKIFTCPDCGKRFERAPSRIKHGKHHFCSRKCKYHWFKKKMRKMILIGLEEKVSKNGRVPTCKEWDADKNIPSTQPIRGIFGTWNNFLRIAGFEKKKEKIFCSCCKKIIKGRYLSSIKKARHHFCNMECKRRWIKENTPSGKDSPCWNRIEESCAQCGEKVFIQPHRTKKYKTFFCSRACAVQFFQGSNAPNWQNGISKLPYSFFFNEKLKERIRERDNYTCQLCDILEEEHLAIHGEVLSVHHIDYDKENCSEENLITLCKQCNARVNFNREYWTEFFNKKLKERKIANGTVSALW